MTLPASAYLVIHLDETEYLTALVIQSSAWRGTNVLGHDYPNPSARIVALAAYLSTRDLA